MRKLLFTLTLLAGWLIGSSTFAVELNATNITQAPFNCSTSATSCNLSNKWITDIAPNTFINHHNLTGSLNLSNNQIMMIGAGSFSGLAQLKRLEFSSNQITNIKLGDFSELTGLTKLDLYSNQITSIESGSFSGLPNLYRLRLFYNCLDTWVLPQSIVALSDTLHEGDWRQNMQYVCVAISYNPITSTPGPVTGTLIFTWWTLANRNTLNWLYPNLSDTYHLWTENGTYGFGLSSISNGLLHHTALGYSTLTGIVTRIWWTPPPSDLNSFFDTCETNPLCSRTNVGLNSFDFRDARKSRVEIWQTYGLTINAKNTSWQPTNRVPLPGGHIIKLEQNIDPDQTTTANLKVKYFVK